MIPRHEWKYRGLPGHFIASHHCLFRLCTDIGKYRISTVGAYYPPDSSDQMLTVGCDRHYETMVFELDEDGRPRYGEELAMEPLLFEKRADETYTQAAYRHDALAEKQHERMCLVWAEKQES